MDGYKTTPPPKDPLKTRCAEVYLIDLQQRLTNLRKQQEEVIRCSTDIIKEISDVTCSLSLTQNSCESSNSGPRIKKLIKDFEGVNQRIAAPKTGRATTAAADGQHNMERALQNFKRLNDSGDLKLSLEIFQWAKQAFDNINEYIDKAITNNIENMPLSDVLRDTPSQYASCCSSVMSLDTFHSTEELPRCSPVEKGYEGDNDDSEYDIFTHKKRKMKFCPSNVKD